MQVRCKCLRCGEPTISVEISELESAFGPLSYRECTVCHLITTKDNEPWMSQKSSVMTKAPEPETRRGPYKRHE